MNRTPRDRFLARSDATLDGEAAAGADLAKCVDHSDIAWYRGVAYDNLADGTPAERAYFLGYDAAMAAA